MCVASSGLAIPIHTYMDIASIKQTQYVYRVYTYGSAHAWACNNTHKLELLSGDATLCMYHVCHGHDDNDLWGYVDFSRTKTKVEESKDFKLLIWVPLTDHHKPVVH